MIRKGKQAYFKEIGIVIAVVLTMVFQVYWTYDLTELPSVPSVPYLLLVLPSVVRCSGRPIKDPTVEDFRTVINDFELIYLPKWFEFESQRNKTNNDHFDSRAKLFYMKRVLLIKLTLVVWYRFYTTTFDMILNQYLDDTIARCTISDRSDRTELFLLSWCHKYNPTIN